MSRWGGGEMGVRGSGWEERREGKLDVSKIKGKNVNFKKEVKHSTLQQRQGMF